MIWHIIVNFFFCFYRRDRNGNNEDFDFFSPSSSFFILKLLNLR